MGQAKLRGSKQKRIDEAIERKEKMKPSQLTCNSCGHLTSDISAMDIGKSEKLVGIEGIFIGRCEACSATTLAMKGDPDSIRYYMEQFAIANEYSESELVEQDFIRQ